MKIFLVIILLLTTSIHTNANSAERDDLWEMTIKTEMPGMPMPEVKQIVCLPKGEAFIPKSVPHQRYCKFSDIKVSHERTTWNMHCPSRDPMKGSGEMSRTGAIMKGWMKLSSENIQMSQFYSGKLLGSCQDKK